MPFNTDIFVHNNYPIHKLANRLPEEPSSGQGNMPCESGKIPYIAAHEVFILWGNLWLERTEITKSPRIILVLSFHRAQTSVGAIAAACTLSSLCWNRFQNNLRTYEMGVMNTSYYPLRQLQKCSISFRIQAILQGRENVSALVASQRSNRLRCLSGITEMTLLSIFNGFAGAILNLIIK